MAPLTDLQRAYLALAKKGLKYSDLWAYYEGRQPLRYANPALRSRFANLVEHFTANWCAVVVDSLLDRLDLAGLSHEDETLSEALSTAWDQGAMALEAEDVHKALAVCGEGFLMADTDSEGGVSLFANPPEICHLFYQGDDPRAKAWAAKWWLDELEGRRYLSLYYPDRYEHYVSKGKAEDVQGYEAFVPTDEGQVANPFAPLLPVFHFRRDRRSTLGELANVVDLQDGFNKLLADMMMAAEYGAFKQRYIISNGDTASLRNAPNAIWEIPAGESGEQPSSVGQFEATDLANFTSAMDFLANKVAVITRTPKHYLLQVSDPSGEALLAMEAPLVKKAGGYQRHLEDTWREVASFILAQRAGVQVPRDQLGVVWNDARTVQPKSEGEARKLAVDVGIPLPLWLERSEGWTADDLRDLEEAQAQEKAGQQASLGEALLSSMRRFDQGEGAEAAAPAAVPAAPGGNGTTPLE
jgi:hypothetical protein